MKSFESRRLFVGAIVFVLGFVTLARANTWTGLAAPDNNWTTTGNWDTGVPGSGATATFDSAGNGNTTISLGGASQPIGSFLVTSASAAAYTIGQLPGDALHFDANGGILVDAGVTTAQTINADILTQGGGLLVENEVSNGGEGAGNGVIGLTLGDVNIGDGGMLFITNDTLTTSTALSGNITEDSGQPASLQLISTAGAAGSSNNNFIISGNNTYSGGTIIQVNTGDDGRIQIGSNSAFGTGKVTTILQSNSVDFEAVGATRTISNAIDMHGGIDFRGEQSIILNGPIAVSSNTSRTLNNAMTTPGVSLTLGASPGSSVLYLGDPADGVGRILIIQAQNGATTIVNGLLQDVGVDSHVRYGSAQGGNIIINALQTYTSETQLGSGSATLQFKHDYNAGDLSGPFGLGTLVANGAANIELAPIEGDRTIANPFRLDFGFTVENVPGDTSSVTFTGPIKFNSGASRLIQNKMGANGGKLILGSAASPNVFELSDTANLTVTFHNSGRTIVNDTIQDAAGVPNNLALANNAHVTFNGPQISDGSFDVAHVGATAIINGNRTGSGPLETEGILVVNGSKIGSGAVTIDPGGTLAGTGSIDGDVANSGTIAPGDETLAPGTLTLTDNVTNLADSGWLIGLDGSTAGKLVIGGDLDLLAVDSLDVVGSGTGPWTIATYAGTLMGTFDNVTPGFAVDYGTIGQIILSGAAALLGDYNEDDVVDAADYVVWRKAADLGLADLPNDEDGAGNVGAAEYTLWRTNFGAMALGSGNLLAGGAVPEPGTLALVLLGIAGLATARYSAR